MKGFPKRLNSKFDYYYIKEHFPKEQWIPCWKALLNNTKNWFFTKELQKKEEGISDENHKVIESTDEKNVTHYLQYELKDDKSCDMHRLGFTESEIKAVINDV